MTTTAEAENGLVGQKGLTSNSVFAPALKWVLNASWLPGFFSTKMPSAKYSVLSFVICGFKKDKKYIPMDAIYFKRKLWKTLDHLITAAMGK